MGTTDSKNNALEEFDKLSRLSSDIAGKVQEKKMTELQFRQFLRDICNDCDQHPWWSPVSDYLQSHAKELYSQYCSLLRTNSMTIGLGHQFLDLGELHELFESYLRKAIEGWGDKVPSELTLEQTVKEAAGFGRATSRLQESVRQFRNKENCQESLEKMQSDIELSTVQHHYQPISQQVYSALRNFAAKVIHDRYKRTVILNGATHKGKGQSFKHHKRLSMFLRKFSSPQSTLKTRKAALTRLYEHLDGLDGKYQRQHLEQLLSEHSDPEQCYVDAYLLSELGEQDAWRLRMTFESKGSM